VRGREGISSTGRHITNRKYVRKPFTVLNVSWLSLISQAFFDDILRAGECSGVAFQAKSVLPELLVK